MWSLVAPLLLKSLQAKTMKHDIDDFTSSGSSVSDSFDQEEEKRIISGRYDPGRYSDSESQ